MLTVQKTKYEPRRTELATESFLIKPNLKSDWLNFFVLLLLYTMQGLPLGLSSAIPILLQSKKDTSYQDRSGVTSFFLVIIVFTNQYVRQNSNYWFKLNIVIEIELIFIFHTMMLQITR